MAWKKSPDDLKAMMDEAMGGIAAEKRTMFGFPCWFTNGYMVAGLFEDRVFVRLSSLQSARLGAGGRPLPSFEPMPGRPMRDYSVIPKRVYSNAPGFHALLVEAVAYAGSLPPKQKKQKKPRRQPSAG